MTQEELELVSTCDLVEELERRHDHSVFIGLKDADVGYDHRQSYCRGHKLMVLGLLAWMSARLAEADEDASEDISGGEDEGAT